ncbi:MAG: 5,10-methylene-tetrahydrofolate dehydrogenase/methenyl tetrahydrofolate cyclohydrolase [Parcubacteria group bacterium Gr01-1014_66]|nr:MAG: 5,10-methylene-tetrahydrofolate dehydrogenase/methenyl tetrahydrofolate cyclohydrolase [Parcubacteria group bacterium Gr01-1014_66]
MDGRRHADRILAELKRQVAEIPKRLRLGVVVVGADPVVRNFIAHKRRAAETIGIDVRIYPFEETVTTTSLRTRIAEIVHEQKNIGVIVQLPLPSQLNRQYILNSIPPEKDVDVLSSRAVGNFATGKSLIIPPVIAAIKMLMEEYHISYQDKYIVVIGAGSLVGKPVALWLLNEKATFSVVRSSTRDFVEFTKKADIVISGIGKPGFITGDMIKEGAIIFDAGTSEMAGEMTGDVDFVTVSSKAGALTPVPGGIGPLTIAFLFQNLIHLALGNRHNDS